MKNDELPFIPEEYNFNLPEELIAHFPPATRSGSRLLIIHKDGSLSHKMVKDLPDFFSKNDILACNETRVSKRRLRLFRKTGKECETLFLSKKDGIWQCLMKGSGRIREGESLHHPESNESFNFINKKDIFSYIKFPPLQEEPFFEMYGEMPLPPYLKRKAEKEDLIRYQTIYAKNPGSVAAPTAGLHFTEEILQAIQNKGTQIVPVNLTVGYGTFAPVSEEQLQQKKLHEEEGFISAEAALAFQSGKPITAAGTTTLRCIESVYRKNGHIIEGNFQTDLFLYPPDRVLSVNRLFTNFHLPSSSLFMLVCAFRGTDVMRNAYHEAIREKYRFFSYGDAMLIL